MKLKEKFLDQYYEIRKGRFPKILLLTLAMGVSYFAIPSHGLALTQTVDNALSITYGAQQPTLNQTLNLTITIKQNPAPNSPGGKLQAYLLNDPNSTSCGALGGNCTDINSSQAVTLKDGNTVLTLPVLLDSSKFKAGSNNALLVDLLLGNPYDLSTNPDVGGTFYILAGTVKLNIVQAVVGQTGALTIAPGANDTFPDSNTIEKNFTFVFTPGQDGIAAASFQYQCKTGDSFQTVTQGKNSVSCDYPKTAGSFTLAVQALDSSGKVIGTPQTSAVQVTGDEISNGSVGTGNVKSANNNSGTLLGLINSIIGIILGFLQEVIYAIFFWLIAPLIQAMLSIHVYTDTFVAVIYPGWVVVRNVCNIFFIIALIIIAMGTLFRLESYQFRHLLVQLIIAALLVNFSLVIGQAVLGLADTVQAQFLPANVTVIRSLAGNLMVAYRGTLTSVNLSNGTFAGTLQPLFWLALSLGSAAVFGAIAIFLLIRIVALWILLLISPIAYAAGVLPSTSQYRTKWWENFLKYAFFTPIMAFFLNLTALIANTYKTNPVLQQINSPDLSKNLGGSDIATFVFQVASNILLLVFLIAALKVADGIGGNFGAGVAAMAQKGIFAPFAGAGWLGKRGLGYAGRKWNEKTAEWFLETHEGHEPPGRLKKAAFAVLNPKAFAKGWQNRSEELSHIAKDTAEAGGRMVAEQLMTGGKLELPYISFVERKHENEMSKDYEGMRKESLMDVAVKAEGLKGAEGKIRRRAIVKAALKQGYMDDLLSMKHFAEKYADDDGTFDSAEAINRFLFDYLGHDDQAMRFMAEDLEDLGKSTGHWEYLGHAYFDPNTTTWQRGMEKIDDFTTRRGDNIERLKNTWQVKYAIGEAKKASAQVRASMAPHNTMVLRAETDPTTGKFSSPGKTVGKILFGRKDGSLDEFQRGMLGQFNANTLTQFSRYGQSRQEEWHLASVANYDKNSGDVVLENADDVNRIEALWKENPQFIRALYGRISGIDTRDVSGMRFTSVDASGKRQVKVLGNYNLQEPPILSAVKTEVSKNPSLKSAAGAALDKVLADVVPKIYNGTYSRADVTAQLSAAGGTVAPLAAGITDDVYSQIEVQIKEKYNPTTIVTRLDEGQGYNFTPAEISSLNREVTEAAGSAFNAAKTSGSKFTRAEVEAEVRRRIGALKASGGNFSKLTTADEDLFINHITPI